MTRPCRRATPAPLAAAILLALPGLAAAQQHAGHGQQPVTLQAVEIRATPLPGTAEDLARPVEVLAGRELDEAKAATLGETLGRLPGVQSSWFGPGVGRPIVRGLDGARVQVLSDGLGSGDVSTVSVDHAVAIEPFLADQIEVLKGPATLLYGSGAIGGAVNVIDGRIAERLPAEALSGRAELRAATVNDERTGLVRLDGAAGNVAFHFDGLHREAGDARIPGFAESARLLAEHGESPDAAARGQLANSHLRTDGAALGASWIGGRGFIGGAYSLYATRYGVPGHGHEGEDAAHPDGHEEGVTIALDQRRSELRGGVDRLGPFESLRFKFADTGYTHTEFEGEAVGTVFDNAAREARLELVHAPWAGWKGAFGLQLGRRDFSATGEEAFVPGSGARDEGLFWIGQRQFGKAAVELGARHERSALRPDDTEAGPARDFRTNNLSAALKWDATDALHLTFGLDRAQRAPGAEELYSDGLHVATASHERGDPGLGVETARRAELGVHGHHGPVEFELALYQVRYDDFIYLDDTGAILDDAPLRQWTQADARFEGAEASLDWAIADNASGAWDLRVFGDRVRARLARGGHLPRIAPARAGLQLRWERGDWRASAGAVRHARQDEVARNEAPSPGYTLVDAHLAWHRDTRGGNAYEVFMDASNLLDREARPHTSFLRDLVPLPGRSVAMGVRLFF